MEELKETDLEDQELALIEEFSALADDPEILDQISTGIEPLVSDHETRYQISQSLLIAFLEASQKLIYGNDLEIILSKDMGFDPDWSMLLKDKLSKQLIELATMPLLLVPDQVILDFGVWYVDRLAKATELGNCLLTALQN